MNRDNLIYLELLYAYYYLEYGDKYIQFFENNKILMYNRLTNSPYYIKLLLLDINYRLLNKQIIVALNLCSVIPNHIYINYETLEDYNTINKIKKIITNKIMTIKSYNLKIINNIIDKKGLYDENNEIVCSICYDEVNNNDISLVECNNCNKYIGHILCIYKWIEQQKLLNKNPSCHICSKSFIN